MKAEELMRLAFIYAEQDRRAMAEAARGLPEGKEALELANKFHDYRTKRWGQTKHEKFVETAITISIDELRKR